MPLSFTISKQAASRAKTIARVTARAVCDSVTEDGCSVKETSQRLYLARCIARETSRAQSPRAHRSASWQDTEFWFAHHVEERATWEVATFLGSFCDAR